MAFKNRSIDFVIANLSGKSELRGFHLSLRDVLIEFDSSKVKCDVLDR